jgi:hypothetical protein
MTEKAHIPASAAEQAATVVERMEKERAHARSLVLPPSAQVVHERKIAAQQAEVVKTV